MLEISPEQMAVADDIARKNFHQRVRDYVREKLPDETDNTPDSKLLAYIGEQDKVAGEHGIKTELGVTKWVCLSLDLGKNFYQKEPAKNFFNTQVSIDGETKLTILGDYVCTKNKEPSVRIETIFAKYGYHVIGS